MQSSSQTKTDSPRRRLDNFTTQTARLSKTATARSRLERWTATTPLRRTVSRSASFSLKQTDSYAPSQASSFREFQARETPGVSYHKGEQVKEKEEQRSAKKDKAVFNN